MDSFDEFEMKPITEGLGFHKKSIQLNKSSSPSPVDDFLSELKQNKIMGIEDLQGEESPPLIFDRGIPTQKEIEEAYKQKLLKNSSENFPRENFKWDLEESFVTQRSGHGDSESKLIQAPFSLMSVFLDFFVVMSFSLIFVATVLWVTQVDLNQLMFSIQNHWLTQSSFVLLFCMIWFLYVITSRIVFNRTLGDWTFDYQLGNEDQTHSSDYALKVISRALLVVISGGLILPLLSLLMRRDWAGHWSGLFLYREV